MDATIEVNRVRKRFGETVALDGLSFTVTPGSVTGFVGPNGAGKSTAMRVILGLDALDEGSALIGGQPYASLRHPLRHVGSLLDAGALQPSRSARNHLLWLAHSQGLSSRRVDQVIEQAGLDGVARRKAGGFSLGMRQRLGLAAAMLGDPPILILDEPFNGMDPEGIVWMRGFLRSLAAEGRAVLVSSHLMSELEGTAGHLVVIGRGRLVADTSVAELIAAASAGRVTLRTSARSEAMTTLADAGATVAATGPDTLTVSGLVSERIVELLGARRVPFSEVSVAQVEPRGGVHGADPGCGPVPRRAAGGRDPRRGGDSVSATAAPYRSEMRVGREGFAQLLRSEWTKFRTVRGWVITTLLAAFLIVLFAYLGTFRHQDGGICVGPNPSAGTCQSFAHPTPPIGPGGEAVTDTYYFVHRTLAGDGTITVRVSSLNGRVQGGGGSGGSVSVQDMAGTSGRLQPWAKAGLIVTASAKPGSAYAAVMLTGGHGVRMQYDYTHDTAGRERVRRHAALAAVDPVGRDADRLRVSGREHVDPRGLRAACGVAADRPGRSVRDLPADRSDAADLRAGRRRRGHRRDRHVRRARPPWRMVGRWLDRAGHRQQRLDHDPELGRLPATPALASRSLVREISRLRWALATPTRTLSPACSSAWSR